MSLNWCACCCLHCYCCLYFTIVSVPVCYQNQSGLSWVNWSEKPVMRFTNSSNFSKHITSAFVYIKTTPPYWQCGLSGPVYVILWNVIFKFKCVPCCAPMVKAHGFILHFCRGRVMFANELQSIQTTSDVSIWLDEKTNTCLSLLAYHCLCIPVLGTGKMTI